MTKKPSIVDKKIPEPRPTYSESNFSAGALGALYEAMGQRVPKPAVPRVAPTGPATDS